MGQGPDEPGDVVGARDGAERVLRDGNGAARQRTALHEHGLPGVLHLIAAAHGDRG